MRTCIDVFRPATFSCAPAVLVTLLACFLVLSGCSSGSGGGNGNGNGSGNGFSNGTVIAGDYTGSWTGRTTNTACADTGNLNALGYCAHVGGAVAQLSLNIIQASATAGSVCMQFGSNTTFIGGTDGGCATSVNPLILSSIDASNTMTFTGTLNSANAGSGLGATTWNVTSWSSVASGSSMTGTWSATVTSAAVSGTATTSWTLTGVTLASSTPSLFRNPLGPGLP